MARKRMIDPEFWRDEKLGDCTAIERLLFMGLISHADDEGRGRASCKLVKSDVFPYDEDIKAESVEGMLQKLDDLMLIELYEVNNQKLYQLPGFAKYQTVNRPTPSKLPPKPELLDKPVIDDMSTHEVLTEDSMSSHEELTPNRIEKKGKEKNRKEQKENVCEEKNVNDIFEKVRMYWNELSLPEYRRLLPNIPQAETREVLKTFDEFSVDEICLAMKNYQKSLGNDGVKGYATMVTFLARGGVDAYISGVKQQKQSSPMSHGKKNFKLSAKPAQEEQKHG